MCLTTTCLCIARFINHASVIILFQVALLNERIEQLRKEGLRDLAERRSQELIQAEMDKLQAKKDQVYARVFGQLKGDGQGDGSARGGGRAPPPSEN